MKMSFYKLLFFFIMLFFLILCISCQQENDDNWYWLRTKEPLDLCSNSSNNTPTNSVLTTIPDGAVCILLNKKHKENNDIWNKIKWDTFEGWVKNAKFESLDKLNNIFIGKWEGDRYDNGERIFITADHLVDKNEVDDNYHEYFYHFLNNGKYNMKSIMGEPMLNEEWEYDEKNNLIKFMVTSEDNSVLHYRILNISENYLNLLFYIDNSAFSQYHVVLKLKKIN